MSDDFTDQPDTYWGSDRVNERDEWDLTLRAWEQDEKERVEEHE